MFVGEAIHDFNIDMARSQFLHLSAINKKPYCDYDFSEWLVKAGRIKIFPFTEIHSYKNGIIKLKGKHNGIQNKQGNSRKDIPI